MRQRGLALVRRQSAFRERAQQVCVEVIVPVLENVAHALGPNATGADVFA